MVHGMLATLSNPLMAAALDGQSDIFNGFLGAFDPKLLNQLVGDADACVARLQQAGLIRADIPVSVITFLMTAIKIGIINSPEIVGQEHMPSMDVVAEALSDLIRRWLEPEQLPGLSDAGKQLFTEFLDKVKDTVQGMNNLPCNDLHKTRKRRIVIMAAIIEVENLSKNYGSKRGIIDVSFQVEEGEVFGFLGPNGAGKTTTIRLLMALLHADAGHARIAGLDVWQKSVEIKKLIGYLPGELSLDPNLTGGQILKYFGHLRGGVDQTYLKYLIKRLDLDPTRKFRQYSSGNKRKIGIIQAFMHYPRLLILDEPTNGLDPLNQQEFDRMVKEVRDDGRTVFLSSHILTEVEQACSRVAIIREGQLVHVGGVAELKDIKHHEVTITFANAAPDGAFKSLEGVEQVELLSDGNTLRLTVLGELDTVVKTAAQYSIVTLTSQEPSLEEIFLRYYEGDGPPPGRPAMWFTSVFLKTLRDFRIAIVGWGVGMGLLMYAVLASFPSLVATPQARASLVGLAGTFSWLAEPLAVDTPGGYATFKVGFLILIITLWPLIVGSRMLRGEEEYGSLDTLLSLPRGRVRVALEKLAAIWAALLIMGLLIALITFAAGRNVSAAFGLNDALLFGLNLALISGVFGSIALLLSQFTSERGTAAGLTGGLLLIFIVLDMVHRIIPNADLVSYFSPVYYFNLSKPLVPGYSANAGAMLLLLVLCIVLSGASMWLFTQRDVGGVVALPRWLRLPERSIRPERVLPVNAWSLRSVYTRSLRMLAVPACWWTLGIVGFAAWMFVVVKQIEAKLATIYQSSPFLKDLISRVGGSDVATNASILSALYTILPLLLMAFAVTQVNRWSADEEDGRLELLLSTPQPRLRVLLGRFAALTTVIIMMGLLTLAVTVVTSVATGLQLDGGNLAAASLGMIPLGLLVAAIGYLFSGWLRTAVDTGLLSFLLVIWFFISFVGPGLNWSDATLRLSVFYYYGTPLLHGLSLGNMLAVLAVGVVALALAAVRFVRKDIGRYQH